MGNDVVSPLLKGLNPELQTAVLNEQKRLLVLAGAGAGKTKTLIQQILHLIFEKSVEPSAIQKPANALAKRKDILTCYLSSTSL